MTVPSSINERKVRVHFCCKISIKDVLKASVNGGAAQTITEFLMSSEHSKEDLQDSGFIFHAISKIQNSLHKETI